MAEGGNWLQRLQGNFIGAEDSGPDPGLWEDLYRVARGYCEGTAELEEWKPHYLAQYESLRFAYRSLLELEEELSESHPALSLSRTIRDQLQGLRGRLRQCRELLAEGEWPAVEVELLRLKTGLGRLGEAAGELEEQLASLRCVDCLSWAPSTHALCPACGGSLEVDDEGIELGEDDDALPPDYARLRELADAVLTGAGADAEVQTQARLLDDKLGVSATETRQLCDDQPELRDQLLAGLAQARAGLAEMAAWPEHRNPGRLEAGWTEVVDGLSRFEELLDELED